MQHENGTLGIAYTAAMEWNGPDAVATALAAGERAGMLCPVGCQRVHFATLDVVDRQGDVISDRCIRDQAAWDWWRRAVELRSTSSDCRICEPAAYASIYGIR